MLKQHPVIAYFALAYALSWTIEIPLAAAAQGWLHASVPPALHYLASFGPMLSALIITAATEGRQGVRQLFAGLVQWRVGLGWMRGGRLAWFRIATPSAAAQRAHRNAHARVRLGALAPSGLLL